MHAGSELKIKYFSAHVFGQYITTHTQSVRDDEMTHGQCGGNSSNSLFLLFHSGGEVVCVTVGLAASSVTDFDS